MEEGAKEIRKDTGLYVATLPVLLHQKSKESITELHAQESELEGLIGNHITKMGSKNNI